ncbi:hypothetical protein FHX64_002773 [Microbacter margulisiae]|uniref:Uncharacterized protein n=1 Tax=Microbacter margulisiae TaxID=1350067 RepID=A0A7W5DT44_9PORP|nr:hypothetical protein [Microbacter margulisiae]
MNSYLFCSYFQVNLPLLTVSGPGKSTLDMIDKGHKYEFVTTA